MHDVIHRLKTAPVAHEVEGRYRARPEFAERFGRSGDRFFETEVLLATPVVPTCGENSHPPSHAVDLIHLLVRYNPRTGLARLRAQDALRAPAPSHWLLRRAYTLDAGLCDRQVLAACLKQLTADCTGREGCNLAEGTLPRPVQAEPAATGRRSYIRLNFATRMQNLHRAFEAHRPSPNAPAAVPIPLTRRVNRVAPAAPQARHRRPLVAAGVLLCVLLASLATALFTRGRDALGESGQPGSRLAIARD